MTKSSRSRQIGVGALIAVVSLLLGYLVLSVLQLAIEWLWFTTPDTLPDPALWALVLGLPTLAGVAVAWLRSHGADGHSPLFGIALNPVTAADYPSIIGAIAATLVGGLVLGPEVALVSTGAFVGTEMARRTGALTTIRGATVGALAAVLALFVGPSVAGTFSVAPGYSFQPVDLIGAVGVGAATAAVIVVSRVLAIGVLRLHGGDRPRMLVLALCGLGVGVIALAYHLATGHEVGLVLTSGENEVKPLLALGSAGAIGWTIAAKWLAYSLSMGGGFRGGPFFPAIYIGAGVGAIATLLTPGIAQGAVGAGLTAAIIYLAQPKWAITVGLGVVMGLLCGGPQIIPLTVAAAVVAALLPGLRDSTKPTGEQQIEIMK
jgi:hypothetical protein